MRWWMTCWFFLIFPLHTPLIFVMCSHSPPCLIFIAALYWISHLCKGGRLCWSLLASSPHPAQTSPDLWWLPHHKRSRHVVIAFCAFGLWGCIIVLKTIIKYKPSPDTHSPFTFPGGMHSRVQPFAAEVTLRKHSCSSVAWCHRRTTPPLLIFNKDKTFISHLQAVGPRQLLERREEINNSTCFLAVI